MPGLKGVVVTLGEAGDNQGLQLKTAFLVKPLNTRHFYVAFAAAAPLIHPNNTSTAKPYGTIRPLPRDNGVQSFAKDQDPCIAVDWMVIADIQPPGRMIPADRDRHLNWIPEIAGDARWHSKVELIFLPADQWTVRTILAMAHDPPQERSLPSHRYPHPVRFGMAIDVDYQILKTIGLGIDYGHYRYSPIFKPAGDDAGASPDTSTPDGPVQTQAISARMIIRF